MPKYIRTELAAIRFFHKRLGSKNKLPTNKQLGIMPNDDYKYNRAFLPNEFKDMIQVAVSMKRYDAVIVSYLARYFELRLEEAVAEHGLSYTESCFDRLDGKAVEKEKHPL